MERMTHEEFVSELAEGDDATNDSEILGLTAALAAAVELLTPEAGAILELRLPAILKDAQSRQM